MEKSIHSKHSGFILDLYVAFLFHSTTSVISLHVLVAILVFRTGLSAKLIITILCPTQKGEIIKIVHQHTQSHTTLRL